MDTCTLLINQSGAAGRPGETETRRPRPSWHHHVPGESWTHSASFTTECRAGPAQDPRLLTSPDTLGGGPAHAALALLALTQQAAGAHSKTGFLSRPFGREGTRAGDGVNSAGRAKEILVKNTSNSPHPFQGWGDTPPPPTQSKAKPKQTHLLPPEENPGNGACGGPGVQCALRGHLALDST